MAATSPPALADGGPKFCGFIGASMPVTGPDFRTRLHPGVNVGVGVDGRMGGSFGWLGGMQYIHFFPKGHAGEGADVFYTSMELRVFPAESYYVAGGGGLYIGSAVIGFGADTVPGAHVGLGLESDGKSYFELTYVMGFIDGYVAGHLSAVFGMRFP